MQSEGARESRSRATAPPCPNGQLPPAWGPELCPTVFLDVSRLLPCVQGRAASTAEVEPGFGRKEVNFSLTTRRRGDNNTLTYGLLKTEAKKNYDAVINVNAPPQNRTENCFQKMEKGSRIGLIFAEVESPVSRGGSLVTSRKIKAKDKTLANRGREPWRLFPSEKRGPPRLGTCAAPEARSRRRASDPERSLPRRLFFLEKFGGASRRGAGGSGRRPSPRGSRSAGCSLASGPQGL